MKLLLKYYPDLSDQQISKFKKLKELYKDWNLKINVVSRKDIDELYLRHVLHSLGIAKIQKFIPGSKILDVGTGGGFPGIPLAILFPEVQFHLVDSIAKKIKVVNEVVAGLNLQNVTITNARVEFSNGCIANFTASRISLKNMRKSRFFQKDAYIAVDFFEKKSEVVKISNFQGDDNYAMLIENAEGVKKQIHYTNPETKSINAIEEEHNDFANSILNNISPQVSFRDGLKALELATLIIKKVNDNN